jgi:hypothetical protein
MSEPRQPIRPRATPPYMNCPINPRPALRVLSFALIALGLYGSWIKFWGDQNWFARAGGLVTFIAGWIVLATDAAGQFLDRQSTTHIEWLNRTGHFGPAELHDRPGRTAVLINGCFKHR